MSKRKKAKEIILDIIAIVTIVLNLAFVFELSYSVWVLIIAVFYGLPIYLNIGNVILAKQVCKKTRLDPLLLLLFHLIIEAIAVFIIMIIHLTKNGKFFVCADGCTSFSFIEMFIYLFLWPQIFFVGGCICYIVMHFINLKKKKTQQEQIDQVNQTQIPNQA